MAQMPADAAPTTPLANPADAGLTLADLKARYSDDESRYATLEGLSIRYKDEGTGTPIVLIHGSYGSLDGFDGLVGALKAKHRVVRFDMPGMGLSEGSPSGGARIVFGDEVLAALLAKLAIDKAVLIGTSSGGVIASYYAAREPKKVTALILANTPSSPLDDAAVPRSPQLRAEFDRARATGMRDLQYWQVYLTWLQGRPERLKPEKVRRYYDMNRRTGATIPGWRTTRTVPELYETLARIAAPTLLVWGRHDYVLPVHAMQGLASRLPSASVSTILLDDVGHYPPLEVPERFARLVEGYLAGVVFQP